MASSCKGSLLRPSGLLFRSLFRALSVSRAGGGERIGGGNVSSGAGGEDAFVVQGTGVVFSLSRLRSAVQQVYGRDTGTAMLLITAMQFHLPFYASRPLPNTFALALVALALADCLLGNNARAIFLLVFTTVSLVALLRRLCYL